MGFPEHRNVSTSIAGDQLLVTVAVTPDPNGALPERYLIRIGNETSLANRPHRIRRGRVIESGDETKIEFKLPRSTINGQRFRYQFGYVPYPDSRHYFEKWRNGTIPTSQAQTE